MTTPEHPERALPEHPAPENATAPKPAPLFTRPPAVVAVVSTLLILFAVLAPAAPGFRAVTVFAALLLLFLVRDRDPRAAAALDGTPPPPPPRYTPAPAGNTRVDVTAPGPNPADVVWVWRQFRALEPTERRSTEEFADALTAATPDQPVTAAIDLSERAADDLAAALRRAGAGVEVGPTT